MTADFGDVLTPDALAFVANLHRAFNPRRKQLLAARAERQARLDAGERPDFLSETRPIREGDWQVAPIPAPLQKRHVEITGPTDRKMVINALNSGADMFMADFEDANSPTFANMVQGHLNLRDAIERTITFDSPDGRRYRLNDRVATLLVRPRGWHLVEKHVQVDTEPISASLFDFGLYFFHNARRLLDKGYGPYFYLPKLESHLEARLWNDVFNAAQDALGLPRGTIKATVLIETILAAFEMEEILYELREHIAGLNAGRWDYIFSIIKKFRKHDVLLPDRAQVTMTVPFMRAYTELLVRTCHKRGAHAIGGMAAFIPSRKDPEVNAAALAKVREDKLRESNDGFDGTWVAHPDLVPVAKAVFDEKLGDRPHQKDRLREDVNVTGRDLIDFHVPGGTITEAGVRNNISVAIQYIEAWLRGNGAVAIFNLMEDAATAEIARAQLWQWIHSPRGILNDGRKVTLEMYRQFADEEMDKIRAAWGDANYAASRIAEAREIVDALVSSPEFIEFLTLRAYERLA
ncbi:MAG: malate synthase A [Anaerolineae bacterium]|nr:malate synthase A [Candidatus Roseilinea sp.]MDW8448835.1 malate synthase A [Anaerolineae bacterium]